MMKSEHVAVYPVTKPRDECQTLKRNNKNKCVLLTDMVWVRTCQDYIRRCGD